MPNLNTSHTSHLGWKWNNKDNKTSETNLPSEIVISRSENERVPMKG